MYEKIDDEIRVGVRFTTDKKIEPVWFFWKGRKYEVEKCKHQKRTFEEESPVHHFSVTVKDRFYQLIFNGLELKWKLKRVWSERE